MTTIPERLEPVFIPPMAGVTDTAFRRIVRQVLGPELAREVRLSTEMVSSKGMAYEANPERLRLTEEEKGRVVVQLFGHEPETMARAAQVAEHEGAAAVDINMGCPVAKITNGKDGAALMKEPELAVEIVRRVRGAVNIPVSVKTRLGWSQESLNARELALRFQDLGIGALTLHGRTRSQIYSGSADWHAIARVRRDLDIPLYANGDVTNPEQVEDIVRTTGAHGVAIARAAIGDPWLILNVVRRLRGLPDLTFDSSQRISVAVSHLEGVYEDKGERGVQAFKKHIGKYISGVRGASVWRRELATAQSYRAMRDAFDRLLESL